MVEPLIRQPNEWHDDQEFGGEFGGEMAAEAEQQPLPYSDPHQPGAERDPFEPDDEALASAAEAMGSATLAGLALPRGGTSDRLIRLGYRLGVPPRLLTQPFARRPKLSVASAWLDPTPSRACKPQPKQDSGKRNCNGKIAALAQFSFVISLLVVHMA